MKLKYGIVFVVLSLPLPIVARSAFGLSLEVVKKCDALKAKSFPPRVPGNPAAGYLHGTGPEIAAFVKKCRENGGNIEGSDKDHTPQEAK